MAKLSSPIIGINLDFQTKTTYSKYPWYALRENYFSAIADHGGIPVAIPYEHGLIDNYLSLIDGLLIPGGRFDIAPSYYNEKTIHDKTEVNSARTTFEFDLCQQALHRKIPIFGICGGMQLMNVVGGGTLIQYIPDLPYNMLDHAQENLRHQTVHEIAIQSGTYLHKLYSHNYAQVNSNHRQAIKVLAKNARISAIASDSIIEAIEFIDAKFCIGIQWHPEFLLTDLDHTLFKAFITAARRHD